MRSLFAAVCLVFAFATHAHAQADSFDVIEYYNASLDHYFISWVPDEIAKLDAGTEIKGWTRTGKMFKTYQTAQAATSPVCRFYIPPALGNSHYFGRGTTECNNTGAKNPSFVLEDSEFMHMYLPNLGTCPADTTPVYRVFSNRPDANHRYMTDRQVRSAMVAKGWLAEGDGPDLVVMCSPRQPPTNVKIYTEIANPLLLSFVPEGGTQTTLFGGRDSVGIATSVTGIVIQESPTSQTLVTHDSSGRPLNVTMADGATMKFSWQPSGNANVDVVTADGENQASVTLQGLLPKSFTSPVTHPVYPLPKADPVKATLQVSVTEFGIPASDATVFAVIEGKSTKKTHLLPLSSVGPGPGLYATQFVNSPSVIPSGASEAFCNSVVNVAAQACEVLEPVTTAMISRGCPVASAELALVATPAAGAALLTTCVGAFVVVEKSCPWVKGVAGTKPAVCKTAEAAVAYFDPSGVQITARASKGATSGSTTKEFASSVTLADMSVNLNCPPPAIPFNGVCGKAFPLTKTWVGEFTFSVTVGTCKLTDSGLAFMTLTQAGATFTGDLFQDTSGFDVIACTKTTERFPALVPVAGTIDGNNTIAITVTGEVSTAIYRGSGTLRNGILKVDISNTTLFGGLATSSFTLK